jgi:hypothetical protein
MMLITEPSLSFYHDPVFPQIQLEFLLFHLQLAQRYPLPLQPLTSRPNDARWRCWDIRFGKRHMLCIR